MHAVRRSMTIAIAAAAVAATARPHRSSRHGDNQAKPTTAGSSQEYTSSINQLTMGIPDLSQADIALIGFGGSTPTPVRVVDFISGCMVLAGVMIMMCVGIMSRLRRIPVVVTITADC